MASARTALIAAACAAAHGGSLEGLSSLRGAALRNLTAPTCADWLKLNDCEEASELRVAESHECDDGECSHDVCCESKASCSFFTMSGGCKQLEVPSNITDQVWSAKDTDFSEVDLFCATSEQDVKSCGKSCCKLMPCKTCSGLTYTTGCMAGDAGTCEECPTESSCPIGQHSKCGDGIFSQCKSCSNLPLNARYTGSSMSDKCPWECEDGYVMHADIPGMEQCVPGTCSKFLGGCDDAKQLPLPSETSCGGKPCTRATCCQAKATCGAYFAKDSSSAMCARVKQDAAPDGKVWAPLEVQEDEGAKTFYCEGNDTDDASCQASCCALQSCKSCSGDEYVSGCEAGSVGACMACPKNSTCEVGEYQTCEEGELSTCQKCKNAPDGAMYTSEGQMSDDCPWDCQAGYVKANGVCLATCELHTCSKEKKLAAIPHPETVLQVDGENADETCCQTLECARLAAENRTALSADALEKGGCAVVEKAAECNKAFVISGNAKKVQGKGATLYTPCTWDESQHLCNWGSQKYRNCVV